MLKTVGKWTMAGALALGLFTGTVSGIGQAPLEAQAAASIYPTEVKVNYQEGYSSKNGTESKQPYVDLGSKTGTLVFKMYPTSGGIYDKNIWLEATKNKGAYDLFDKPTAFEEAKFLYAFDLYALGFKKENKYESGMKSGGTAPNGRNYVALGVYINKALNGGRYYLDHPSMSEGTWEIKAYFYEGVDYEDGLYSQVNKLFPFVSKVMWGKTEVKPGQTGKLTIKEPITLWKETDGKLVALKTLNKGEEYRIYGYRADHGGQYAMGAGTYVNVEPAKAFYETPSKAKLQLAKMLYQD